MRTLRKLWLSAALVPFVLASCGSDDDGTGNKSNPTPDAATGGTGGSAGSDAATGGTAGTPSGGTAGSDGSAGAPQDGWDPNFALPGINGSPTSTVFSIAITPARKVWVGGEFNQAGDLPAKNVALWNGEKWTTAGLELDKQVGDLAATPDEKMYALTSVNEPVSEIFYWDGTQWTSIPAVTDGKIHDIDVAPDGTLYAAGQFTTIDGVSITNVAKRTATGWVALGTGGPTDYIETLKVVGTKVCVGGNAFDLGVRCFDGTTWQDLRANLAFGFVYSLAGDSSGKLYAGGTFMLEGIDTGGGLASWNGTEWELVGGGLTGEFGQPDVQAIGFDGDKLYATGLFAFASGAFVRNAAMWNGKKWSDLNGGISKLFGVDFLEQPRARTLAIDDGGEVYVGGRLTYAGSTNALRIARWDGADWHGVDDPKAVRLGINGPFLNAIYAASDGSIYAGGMFEHLGGDVVASNVARFDPSQGQWYSLGAGLADVKGFTERDGDVYATGGFLESGPTTSVRGVARWDGAAWKSVGGGIEGYGLAIVKGPDNKLYVGGGIVKAGDVDTNNIAVWDGDGWDGIGHGLGDPLVGEEVRAMAFDSSGKLYAGGMFTVSDTTTLSNVATWNGTAWEPLGDGVDASVDSMVFYKDKIVIGGTFANSGADEVLHVASWDSPSSKWVPLGGGLPPGQFGTVYVQDMVVHGDDLYVVGLMENAGTTPVSHMARFDGTTWHDVDGGVSDVAEGVTASSDSLWVGGTFTQAGKFGSTMIARYWFKP